jgi:diguanylate cyclase (GGDEF)-like protein
MSVSSWRHNWQDWRAVPLRAQVFVAVVTAVAAAQIALSFRVADVHRMQLLTLILLAAASVVNIEFGRWIEGGRLERDRTHKGLSAWPFTAALLLPPGMAGYVAVVAYAYMRARGIRIALWKWVLSWAAVALGTVVAARTIRLVVGGGALPADGSGRTVIATILAALAFLATETLIFLVISRLNSADDEVHLRRALASRDYYVTELVVLAGAAIAAILVRYSPWAILITVPGYLQMQRAVIYRALRDDARSDRQTGLLNSEAWRTEAVAAWERARRRGLGVAILMIDIDHFKSVNDTYGHLVGDEVLVRTAAALSDLVRRDDLVGRYGGEEFCILLQDVDRNRALAAGNSILTRIKNLTFGQPDLHITTSVGLAVADQADPDCTLSELLAIADSKLYEAKNDGRNRMRG